MRSFACGHPPPEQRGRDRDQRERDRMKGRRCHAIQPQHGHIEHRQDSGYRQKNGERRPLLREQKNRA
jgi:hypothetical protein